MAFDLHGTPPGPKNEQDYPNLWDVDCPDPAERLRKTVANGFAIGMIQADSEALEAAAFIRDEIAPVNIMELGTCCGGWLYVMDQMRGLGQTISVDRPWFERDPKPKWGPEMLRREIPHLVEFTGDIHDVNVRNAISPRVIPFLDLLFIDADHSFEGTARHWEMYSPLVRKGGWIGFHDIANGWACGQFYQRAKEGRPSVEFIARPPSTVFGIGFIQV